jgi:thioredoxin 2
MMATVELTAENFNSTVTEGGLVLVDFWAAWCGPCRMAAPEVKKVATQMAGRAVVLKVDTDKNPELASRFHVRGIPNFAVFRGGRLVHQQAGLVTHEVMRRWIESEHVPH